MIRRTFAVLMTFALIALLLGTLMIHRANQTVLSADFYTSQLATLGAFDAVHDEVLPTALNDFLTEQESKLPDNLADVELPTDAASQQLILDFARTALPPEYLESVATEGIAAVIAYLTGQRDDLNWNLSFNQPVEAAFGTTNRDLSAFEQTWTTLDLTTKAFDGLSAAVQLPELETFENAQAIQMLALFRGVGLDLQTSSSLADRLYESAPEESSITTLTTRVLDGAATEADLELLQGFFVVEGIPVAQAVTLVDTMATEGAPSEVTSLSLMLGEDQSVAIEWFQGELFGAVRELTSYLSGASNDFAIHVDFSAHPEIAEFAAGPLKSTPDELVRDGYGLTGSDINDKLAASDTLPVDSIELARAWFTPAGRTLSIDDLQNLGGGEPAASAPGASTGTTEAGTSTLDTARSIISPISSGGLLFGVIAVVLTTLQIGLFGGRQWWSRAVWGASALAVASLVNAIVAGPIYGALVSPLISDAIGDTRADLVASDNAVTSIGVRALDQLETVINQQVGAVATNALVIGLVALLIASAAVAVHVYLDRRAATSEKSSTPYSFEDATKTVDEDHDSADRDAA